QSNPGFPVQAGFVPVGYDLYSQAPPFAGAGMEGLPAGSPATPHPLVPYMQASRLPAGSAGDAMRLSHYPQWQGIPGVRGEAAGLGMAAMLQQQQFMQQQRRLHQQQVRLVYIPVIL
ncbi:unnamed protein product, partial [Laminaria digitata]